MVKHAAVLARVRSALSREFYRVTDSARTGMEAHGLVEADVLQVLNAASEYEEQRNGRIRVEGDMEGDPVRVIVEIEVLVSVDQVVIVSVHRVLARG